MYYAEAYNEFVGPSSRQNAWAAQLLSKKCCNGGEPLATLCPTWPARDFNLKPPAPETNALPLRAQENSLIFETKKSSFVGPSRVNEVVGYRICSSFEKNLVFHLTIFAVWRIRNFHCAVRFKPLERIS